MVAIQSFFNSVFTRFLVRNPGLYRNAKNIYKELPPMSK